MIQLLDIILYRIFKLEIQNLSGYNKSVFELYACILLSSKNKYTSDKVKIA